LLPHNPIAKKVIAVEYPSHEIEASVISKDIETKIKEGVSPSDIAIIYRLNSLSTEFEFSLSDLQIKYKLIGGYRFFERKNIKEVFSFIDFFFKKDDASLERIINVPSRGVGNVT